MPLRRLSDCLSKRKKQTEKAQYARKAEGDEGKTYFSLAIVLDRDINNGRFWPSYVLCMANTTSEKRSGWRVVKQFGGSPTCKLAKVLVTSIHGHEDMIDYLSDYNTQNKFKGIHYYPKGALCWFECNKYGDPTGAVYFIRRVPDEKYLEIPRRKRGYKRLLEKQNYKPTIKELLLKEREDVTIIPTVKPRLHQNRKENKHAKNKSGNRRSSG